MIVATFFYSKDKVCLGFKVCGHSGFADSGFDIVCSAVSCAVQMCCNGITEIIGFPAEVFMDSDTVSIRVKSYNDKVQILLESLKMELNILKESYSENISLFTLEV